MPPTLSPEATARLSKLPARTRDALELILRHARLVQDQPDQQIKHVRHAAAELPASAPKWLREEVTRLVREAEVVAALRWPDFPEPQPLPPVESGERTGWSFHQWDMNVSLEETICSARGWRSGTGSFWSYPPQYATKQAAAQAAHWSLARKCAQALMRSLTKCA